MKGIPIEPAIARQVEALRIGEGLRLWAWPGDGP